MVTVLYRIHGIDTLMGTTYVKEKTYASKEEALKRCRHMEWVETADRHMGLWWPKETT